MMIRQYFVYRVNKFTLNLRIKSFELKKKTKEKLGKFDE